MTVRELTQRMNRREFLAWNAYLDDEWNRPDRHDHYLMVIAAEVRRVLAKKPNRIKVKDFKLDFSGSGRSVMSKEQATEVAKAKYLGVFAKAGVQVIRKTKEVA